MKKTTKILAALVLIIVFLINAVSCVIPGGVGQGAGNQAGSTEGDFYIKGENNINLTVGESLTLELYIAEGLEGEVIWTSSSSAVEVENGLITAHKNGIAVIKATLGTNSDSIIVNAVNSSQGGGNVDVGGDGGNENPNQNPGGNGGNGGNGGEGGEEEYIFGSEYPCISIQEALMIAEGHTSYASAETYYIIGDVTDIASFSRGEMTISDGYDSIYIYKSSLSDGSKVSLSDITLGYRILIAGCLRNYKGTLEVEEGRIIAYYNPETEEPPKPGEGGGNGGNGGSGGTGNENEGSGSGSTDIIPDKDDPVQSDPYVNVSKEEFYANYTPAISYMDAYYRTKHNLMSGSIAQQDQRPTIAEYQPMSGGKYIRNNLYLFSEDGNTYYVVDCYGDIAFEIYRGGAYVVLEEVAAYVFAFGEPPANQTESKKTSPTSSPWGIYLRVNHTQFSGSTTKYPYEPELPRISGCGGDLIYYEMDIGTTGTDCDPDYDICDYNNGYTITRGAARIVYSAEDRNGNRIIDLDERYVFYTYNHYNDFQEYLNYRGGWGEMFGNVTGGGTLSSKYNYNPTPYVNVVHAPIGGSETVAVIYYYVPKETFAA